MQIMDELALALGKAQADSLRPVAAPAGLR
jgi:hypothetical protein